MAIMVGVVGHFQLSIMIVLIFQIFNQRMIVSSFDSKIPTIGAMAYKYSIGQPFVYQETTFHMENYTYFSVPSEDFKQSKLLKRWIDFSFTCRS